MSSQRRVSYAFGAFFLDPGRRTLLREGVPVPLTPKVFETLVLLVENADRVVEKDELIEAIWPDTFVEERNLAQNIFTLRKALGGDKGDDKCIETIPKHGYRFVADVKVVVDEGDDLIVEKRVRSRLVIREEEAPSDSEAPERDRVALPASKVSWWTTRRYLVSAALTLSLGGILFYFGIVSRAPGPTDLASVKSIAVLPFKPIAGSDTDHLGAGMADAIITRLSGIRRLIVRPTRSVLKYESTDQDLLEAGRDLRVDSVLDGKIQRDGDRLRVTLQLVRVSDGASLWDGTFDQRFTDIFGIQDAISERVTRAMAGRLTGEDRVQLSKSHRANPEAYQSYLKGRYLWNKRTEAGLKTAVQFFQEATDKDPSYAPAYVGLAECYAVFTTYGIASARESFPRAEEAALKALELDERLAEAHASLGVIRYEYDWDWRNADKEFKRALELSPNYATGHQWYGGYLVSVARFDEGIEEIKKAQELDPISPIINASVGWFYYFKRRDDKAVEELRKALAIDENSVMAHFFLGQAYMQGGQYADAVAELHKALALSPDEPQLMSVLVHASALAGNKTEAEQTLARLFELSKRTYVPPYNVAEAYVGLGDRDRAFEWLAKAFDERSPDLVGLKTEPRLDPIRSDPRFERLVSRVGFP